jgi:16S rRNA (cytosine967-C5)-methyltransferase
MFPMMNPRSLAVTAFSRIKSDGAYANLLTNEMLQQVKFDRFDSSLFTDLVNGTTRYRRYLDYIIENCANRDVAAIEPDVLSILELSAYSHLIRNKPSHAVVNEGVETARDVVGERAVGFVNAILRKLVSKSKLEWDALIAEQLTGIDLISTLHSLPNWISEYFHKQIPTERELLSLLERLNSAPKPTFLSPPNLRHAIGDLTPGNWSSFAFEENQRGSLKRTMLEGGLIVQDEGSQLVALALLLAPIIGTDKNWLDMTAGPGGKATFLAAASIARSANLTANEIHPHRASLVKQSLDRLGLSADVVVGDALTQNWVSEFDRVLLDAPCTGLGALRRRAESRWRKSPADLVQLVDLQKKLLGKAVTATRSGGIVGYTTCSLHPRETEEVVEFVAKTQKVQILDAPALLPHIPMEKSNYIRLWPHRHDTDGMFMAILRVS